MVKVILLFVLAIIVLSLSGQIHYKKTGVMHEKTYLFSNTLCPNDTVVGECRLWRGIDHGNELGF